MSGQADVIRAVRRYAVVEVPVADRGRRACQGPRRVGRELHDVLASAAAAQSPPAGALAMVLTFGRCGAYAADHTVRRAGVESPGRGVPGL